MTEFRVGDVVRVEMPRGYNKRGVLGISVMYTTWPEAKFEGATGRVTEINPVGPQMVHQYLVDFRQHDNSRVGIPWQANWFREEFLSLQERPVDAPLASRLAGDAASAGTATATMAQPATDPSLAVTDHLRWPKGEGGERPNRSV